MLNLAHQLLLLELEDGTGKSLIENSTTRQFAIPAALVGELQMSGVLVSVGADQFAVSDAVPMPSDTLGIAAEKLRSHKPRPLAWCISQLAHGWNDIRRPLLQELVELGALRMEKDKLWFITWRTRWPAADAGMELGLIAHMRHWMLQVQPEHPPAREDLLLSLLRVCKLLEVVWQPAEIATLEKRIEQRTSRAPIGATVHELARQFEAAAAIAVA